MLIASRYSEGGRRDYRSTIVKSDRLLGVRHSTLVAVVDARRWAKKTYNNALSTLRRAFEFGYCDYPDRRDPATTLRSARIGKKDRNVDPFSIHEAERLIAAIHTDWGAAQGNYDEFRLFSGLRPSEQIALRVTDLDLDSGVLSVTKARVGGVDKDVTKTREDRRVLLCPRALAVMHRQLHLRERLCVAGCIDHDHLFFHETGAPFRDLRTPQVRRRRSLMRLPIRYRRPYVARHTSVSWNLMLGRNPLWVARQHGHSLLTMLRVYAAWAEGMLEPDVAAIAEAMGLSVAVTDDTSSVPNAGGRLQPVARHWPVDWPVENPRARATAWEGLKKTGGKGGTRTRRGK